MCRRLHHGPVGQTFLQEGTCKAKTPGEWILIVDFFSPEGRSVDDGINEHWCSPKYEDALHVITALGRGSLLAKERHTATFLSILHTAPSGEWYERVSSLLTPPSPLALDQPLRCSQLWQMGLRITQQERVDWIIYYLDDF